MNSRVLVLFAHPALEKSKVNKALARAAREVSGVTFHDLYQEYPDFMIDVKREQTLLNTHDVVVFQHPFYWYNTPAILKEWADLVLQYGYAYGENGTKLQGKGWVHALTTGGPASAYNKDGYNRYTIRQLLAPLDQTAHLCGMHFLNPFVIHGSIEMEEKEIQPHARKYQDFLNSLKNTRSPWSEFHA